MNNFIVKRIVTYLPDNIVSNDDLTKYLDTSDEWIYKRTGIKERRIETELSTVEMVEKAIDNLSNVELNEIDGIICATATNEYIIPSIACQLASKLKVNGICTDINNACSGYVYALHLANGLFKTGEYNKILIVCAEKLSNVIDKNDRATAILFGDAVTVSVLESSTKQHLLEQYLKTNGSIDELYIKQHEYMHIKGQDVFKFAIRAITDCLDNIDHSEVDYYIFHQANMRIIEVIIKHYNLDSNKVLCNIDKYGNTSSASIPLVLSEHQFKTGDNLLLCAFGAGLSYGAITYQV